MKNWFCNVIAALIQNLKDFIWIEQSFKLRIFHFFLLLVPIPFVDLAWFETSLLCKLNHILSGPVIVLWVFILQDFYLFFILSSSLFLFRHCWRGSWNIKRSDWFTFRLVAILVLLSSKSFGCKWLINEFQILHKLL